MISRVHGRGRSFKKLCSYLATGEEGLQLERERVLWVECFNLPTRNWEVAACMMAATASTSVSNTQEPLYHFTISCHPDDPVDSKTLRRIAHRSIRDMGLRDYQVVVFAHKDRSHLHLHFVVNRVHPERCTLWSMWRDCYRMERSLRAQERELGLLIVPGWLAPTPAVEGLGVGVEGPGQEGAAGWLRPRPGPRRGDDDFLHQVTERATPVLERAQSWAELKRGLADHGLSARVHRGGLQFTDGRFQVKASAVGRAYSRKNLEKRFGGYPGYRARMAVASQTIVPPARALRPVAPAQQQEPPVPPRVAPAPEVSAPVAKLAQPSPQERVDGRGRPQFGDAGHGIAELFGNSQASTEREPAVPSVERDRASEPNPEHGNAVFLTEVQERAGLVFRRAKSWAELGRGLAEQGLILRMSGGGFTVTDGRQEVKASDVGRAFSRFHLEKRLGQLPAPALIFEPEAPARLVAAAPETLVEPQQPTPPAPPRQLPLEFPVPRAPELSSRPRVSPPVPTGSPALPVEPPTPVPAVPPRVPDERSVELAPPSRRPDPPPVPVAVPRRIRTHPPSERDKYREVVWMLRHELAAVYRDPRAARRAFDVELGIAGPADAVRTLVDAPETYGRLRVLAKPERMEDAARWADVYVRWQSGRTGPARRAATELLIAASITEESEAQFYTAKAAFHEAANRRESLKRRDSDADSASPKVRAAAAEVYVNPRLAIRGINAYRKNQSRGATLVAVRTAPEQFGALLSDKGQGAWSGLLNGQRTNAARERAGNFADQLEAAYRAFEARPRPEDHAEAEATVSEASRAMDAAERRWRALSQVSAAEYVTQAARVLEHAASESGQPVERVMRQLAPKLPQAAVRLALKVLEGVHDQERSQERGRTDFSPDLW